MQFLIDAAGGFFFTGNAIPVLQHEHKKSPGNSRGSFYNTAKIIRAAYSIS